MVRSGCRARLRRHSAVSASQLSAFESYARFAEVLVAALSSVTRDGYLYRVDLRLRPDGKDGVTCLGARAFTDYLENRAVEWEWLAYVKLRAAAGDLELGRRVEHEARKIIHGAAQKADKATLRSETRRVRERLERERPAGQARRQTSNTEREGCSMYISRRGIYNSATTYLIGLKTGRPERCLLAFRKQDHSGKKTT